MEWKSFKYSCLNQLFHERFKLKMIFASLLIIIKKKFLIVLYIIYIYTQYYNEDLMKINLKNGLLDNFKILRYRIFQFQSVIEYRKNQNLLRLKWSRRYVYLNVFLYKVRFGGQFKKNHIYTSISFLFFIFTSFQQM